RRRMGIHPRRRDRMALRSGGAPARKPWVRTGAELSVSHTSALAALERVFDTGSMSAALPPTSTAAAEAVADARALTQRLSAALGIPTATTLIDQARPRPVTPGLTGLFAHGGLPHGEAVVMSGRPVLSLA